MKTQKKIALLLGMFLAVSGISGCMQTDEEKLESQLEANFDENWESQIEAYLDKNMDKYLNKYFGIDEAALENNGETPDSAQAVSLKTFTAQTLDGGTFAQEDIKSKDVTVMNFWTTSCGPCIAEMPDLAAFQKALPENVQLVTVCLDAIWGAEESAKKILQDSAYEGITLVSGDGDFANICNNIQYTPTTIFIDAEGNMVGDAIIGGQPNLSESFLEAVNAVLKSGGKAEISLES